jgi:hypothetical protein
VPLGRRFRYWRGGECECTRRLTFLRLRLCGFAGHRPTPVTEVYPCVGVHRWRCRQTRVDNLVAVCRHGRPKGCAGADRLDLCQPAFVPQARDRRCPTSVGLAVSVIARGTRSDAWRSEWLRVAPGGSGWVTQADTTVPRRRRGRNCHSQAAVSGVQTKLLTGHTVARRSRVTDSISNPVSRNAADAGIGRHPTAANPGSRR